MPRLDEGRGTNGEEEMGDDYEFDDEACPACGAYPTHWRDCTAIGCDDGEIDLYEYDDPINFDPGDTEPCRECFGTGILHWCHKCGFDFQDPRNMGKVRAARDANKEPLPEDQAQAARHAPRLPGME